MIHKDIVAYNKALVKEDKKISKALVEEIEKGLPKSENKLFHRHPAWFLDGNPIVGYSKQKKGIRLMFWSGADFDEPHLEQGTGKFKDASIFYNSLEEIKVSELKRWLKKSKTIQWDYKNIVKRKGKLIKLV